MRYCSETIVTGAVLPVWKKLGGLASSGGGRMADVFSKTRIVRTKTDDGQRLVGMAIDGVDEQALWAALGGGGGGDGGMEDEHVL